LTALFLNIARVRQEGQSGLHAFQKSYGLITAGKYHIHIGNAGREQSFPQRDADTKGVDVFLL